MAVVPRLRRALGGRLVETSGGPPPLDSGKVALASLSLTVRELAMSGRLAPPAPMSSIV
jgi:hypothetical protein